MSTKPQIVLGLLCFYTAQALLVFGLALLLDVFKTDEGPIVALALIAASLLLAMWGLIDPLVPEAGRVFTWAIKGGVLAVFFVCTALTLFKVTTGRHELPWLS